jgi:hypothetical protein
MKIPFVEVEVGKQYQYEEKYHLAATVTVLEKVEEESNRDGIYPYFRFTLRVDEVIFGLVDTGQKFTAGGTTNPNLRHYVPGVFKPVGSPTDYVRIFPPTEKPKTTPADDDYEVVQPKC